MEQNTRVRKAYKSYKDLQKRQLLHLIYERSMSTHTKVLKLQINPCTAQRCVQNDQENPQMYIIRQEGSERPRGKPAILDDGHKNIIVDLMDN
jgi:hypothetical protein